MSTESEPESIPTSAQLPRRAKVRPFELVGISAVLGVFAGVVVVYVTRDLRLASIFAGVGFILALMVFALLALSIKPSKEDEDARRRLLNHPESSDAH